MHKTCSSKSEHAGVTTLPHRRLGAFYRQLLEGNVEPPSMAPVQDDGDWLLQPVAMEPLLAVADRDPEDEMVPEAPDTSASHWWGHFQFTHVTRIKVVGE